MANKPATVEAYLASLPEDRRAAVEAVRRVILKNLGKGGKGYEEGMQYGMVGYYVPHRVYPAGYHCDAKQPLPFAAVASQKGHISVYLMGLYTMPGEEAWFRAAWAKTGKKLDMGKSCVRFKKIEDAALEVIGESVRRIPAEAYIAQVEKVLGVRAGTKKGSKGGAAKAVKTAASKDVAPGKARVRKSEKAGTAKRGAVAE